MIVFKALIQLISILRVHAIHNHESHKGISIMFLNRSPFAFESKMNGVPALKGLDVLIMENFGKFLI